LKKEAVSKFTSKSVMGEL